MSGFQRIEKVGYGSVEVMSGLGSSGLWCAWGKRGRLTMRCVLREPGQVYFAYGDTRESAVKKLLASDFPDVSGAHTVEFRGPFTASVSVPLSIWCAISFVAGFLICLVTRS